eukprot:TRINITY_DN45361_c0_g1_i3.p2 TRINITY_DN45361_c0_g1~~TRINITY_DN45361_c0_g1_i3.p2  ORF type:complete len:117 (+),score=17.88 TRINITY_DN45361_c0_g1_i3:324-674(+)
MARREFCERLQKLMAMDKTFVEGQNRQEIKNTIKKLEVDLKLNRPLNIDAPEAAAPHPKLTLPHQPHMNPLFPQSMSIPGLMSLKSQVPVVETQQQTGRKCINMYRIRCRGCFRCK